MRTVYKYPVPSFLGQQHVYMSFHQNPIIRYIGMDHNEQFCIWAEVDKDSSITVQKVFFVVGTGDPIPQGYHHVMTGLDIRSGVVRMCAHFYEEDAHG